MVVVTVPGLGDDVQAIKAGVLEIADVFAVNKADREGVERAVRDLQMMLELRREAAGRPERVFEHGAAHRTLAASPHGASQGAKAGSHGAPAGSGGEPALWEPPIVKTVAVRDAGVGDLVEAVERHLAHLDASGERPARERARARAYFLAMLRERLMAGALARLTAEEGRLDELAARIAARECDPFALVDELAALLRT